MENTAECEIVLSSLAEENTSLDEAQCYKGSSFLLYKHPSPLISLYLLNVFYSDSWNYMAFAH